MGTRSDADLPRLRWARQPGQLWRIVAPVPTTASGDGAAIQPDLIAGPAPSAPSVTFWAYTNSASAAEVDYLASDSTWQPYVTLSIPAGALLRKPNGWPFHPVDSIQVTVSVDSNAVLVRLDPTGLQFNPLAMPTLTLSYAGANPDFNGDGVVDSLDQAIEQTLLGVYVQEDPLDPWALVSSVHDVAHKSFVVILQHFSGYAVSY